MRATQRLIARGFEAYLVGGCVRDMLLGRTAKDYDIATEARPQQVKRTFSRNCRIIGRRFKLAHLHFNDNTKILEVSTFRRTPQVENTNDDDLLITRDNEFGTAEEDALRRDFTVNALFLDPTRDLILDYTNGLADVKARVIRTIGDPRVRFREDPVRILRAAKFAGRLGFTIEAETFAAMAETSGDLVRAAPPRVLEEILRLLRGGHALDSFQLLRDVGALRTLVPVLADFLQSARHDQRTAFWRLLGTLDHRLQKMPPSRSRQPGSHQTGIANSAVLLGALLVCPVLAMAENNPGRSPSSIAEELLGPLAYALRLPRRDAGCLKRICGVQHRFLQSNDAKRFRVDGFVHGPYFEEAFDLFELRMQALGDDTGAVAHWRDIAEHAGVGAPMDDERGPRADRPEDDDSYDEPTHRHVAHDDREPVSHADDDREPANLTADADHGEDAPRWPSDEAAQDRDTPADAPLDADRHADETTPGPRRRRRRGRRRGRRGGGDEREPHQPDARVPHDAAPAAEHDDDRPVADDDRAEPPSPLPRRSGWRGSFTHPEGAEDVAADGGDRDAPRDFDAPESSEPADTLPSPHGEIARADEPFAPGEPGRRRRRRRRRRGRNRDGAAEDRFPASQPPAPHGEAIDEESPGHERLADEPIHPDPDAPRFRGGDEGHEHEGHEHPPAGEPADELREEGRPADEGQQQQDRGGRRRRRRGRRGRGGGGGNGGGQQPRQEPGRPAAHQQHQQHQQPQPSERRPHDQRGNRGHDRNQQRHDRHERRDQRRRGGGGGAPRDVDVVPRYRDRRGKVDVIEPTPLDLSAFDVELDPKRVPTFGSIVEGKGRPKKRTPRVPEDGVDDYRPPPPPGGDAGPGAPPPPPPSDDSGGFGDW